MAFLSQDGERRCRVTAHRCPQLAKLETLPPPLDVFLPAIAGFGEFLDNEKVDQVLDGGPESPAADREMKLFQRSARCDLLPRR